MKTGWAFKRIGDICDLATGGTPSRSNPEYFNGNIKWLVSGDIHQGEIFDCEGRISEAGMQASNAKFLPVNSVMIALNGQGKTRGSVALLRTRATCNQSLVSINPKASAQLLPEFLYAYLHGRYQIIRRMTGDSGNDRRGLNMGLISSIKVPIAPLSEQQRIVGILDKAFGRIVAAKLNAEKNVQNARILFESHLQAVFDEQGGGGVQKPLVDLCEERRVITYGVIKLGSDLANGVPCLRTSNVRWLRIDTDEVKRIAPSLSAEYARTMLKGGEVLVNVRGTLGGVAVATPDMAGWNVSREVAVVPVDSSRVNPAFLAYQIASGASQRWLGGVKKGAAYVGINIEDLRLLPVKVPNRKKQVEVVQHLDAVREESERLVSVYRKKLDAFEELKQSLLHHAFNGEL